MPMQVSKIHLAVIIAATSVLAATAALMLTGFGTKQQQSSIAQAAAETWQIQQRLSALQHRLDMEIEENKRLRKQMAVLERNADKPQANMSIAGSQDVSNPAAQAVFDEHRYTPQVPTFESIPWDRLRSDKMASKPSSRETDNADSRVATIASALSLGADQEVFYTQLLSDYENRVDALYDRVAEQYDYASGTDPFQFQDMLLEIEQEKSELDAMFDEEFSHVLSEQQAARYLTLPAEERGVGPNAGIDRLDLQMFDLPFMLSRPFNTDQAF
jgi:hypothetical protein